MSTAARRGEEAQIQTLGLTVSYGAGVPAVDRLDLSVATGSWVCIVGPNGAGKSSVLRAIAGLIRYTGTVRLGGVDAATMRPRERARRVALVPQLAVVPQPMPVADYVLLGRTPYIPSFGAETRTDRAIAAETLDDLGMRAFAARPLGSLSGGELQRVVLARSLAQHAPVLLLDEPTTFLDVGHQQDALELVDTMRLRDGLTVVSVMHDLTLAGQFADELVLLAGGVAVASGPAREVLTEASIREHYGAAVRVLHDAADGTIAVMPHRHRASSGSDDPADSGEGSGGPATPPTERPRRAAAGGRVTSLVLVHTGDGKGKTTAAVGTAMRAVALGWRVGVVQFLKSGKWRPGEEAVGRQVGIDWRAMGDGFTWDSSDMDTTRRLAVEAWETAKAMILAGEHRLVVLDEVTYPMTWGWIGTDDVVETIRLRPAGVSVIATGRDAPEALVEIADTVTEMRSVRHAFDSGIPAVRGIDF